ncbi:MAG: hypothetical protein AMXMBFR8_26330 [Nevskiales bacterium]
MTMKLISRLLAVATLGAAANLQAASITLVPSASNIIEDTLFTVNVVLDASGAPGADPGLYIGEVTVDFDPTQLAYQSFAFTSPVGPLGGAPSVGAAGDRQTVTFGFQQATNNSTIGTFSFLALGSPGTIASLGVADADDFIGTFIAKLPTDQPFYPEFNGASVAISPVPLPATAWLLVTALAAASARARRARHQHDA